MASLKSVPNIPDPVDVTSPTSATSEEESIVSKVKILMYIFYNHSVYCTRGRLNQKWRRAQIASTLLLMHASTLRKGAFTLLG